MRRQGEFPHWVIEQKHSMGVCEMCGCGFEREHPFHVHHKIYLEFGIKAGIPLAVLQSYENAMLIHNDCHTSLHNEWWEPDPEVVREVLGRCGVQTTFRD